MYSRIGKILIDWAAVTGGLVLGTIVYAKVNNRRIDIKVQLNGPTN